MFCPKCGNQLPDGAAFCTSCGSPINSQPTTPATPVVTPVVNETPVVTETPVVNETPVMNEEPIFGTTPATNGEPIFGATTPVTSDMPAQAPMNGQFIPQSQGSYPNAPAPDQMQQTAYTTKKNKTPLYVGLAIGILLIVIIAIIIVIVVTGDDKDEKDNPTDGKETTSNIENESTDEKETTTKKPGTGTASGDIDFSDAEDVVEDFLYALADEDTATAAELVLPSMVEYINSTEYDIETYLSFMTYAFYDPDYDFLDYTVKSAEEYNGDSFYDTYYSDIKDMSSYVEPTAFASVEIEFTYEDQASSMYFHLAYCDDKFYFYNGDDEDFYLEFEEKSTSNITTGGETSIDIADSLESNYKTINAEPSGTRTSFDGYSMIIPDGWEESGALYYEPVSMTNIGVSSAPGTYDAELLLDAIISQYASMGATVTEIGNLTTSYNTGYYIEYTIVSNGITCSGTQFVYENNDTTYYVTITTQDPDSDIATEGLRAAASLIFE